jgi:hypothetical protein
MELQGNGSQKRNHQGNLNIFSDNITWSIRMLLHCTPDSDLITRKYIPSPRTHWILTEALGNPILYQC